MLIIFRCCFHFFSFSPLAFAAIPAAFVIDFRRFLAITLLRLLLFFHFADADIAFHAMLMPDVMPYFRHTIVSLMLRFRCAPCRHAAAMLAAGYLPFSLRCWLDTLRHADAALFSMPHAYCYFFR